MKYQDANSTRLLSEVVLFGLASLHHHRELLEVRHPIVELQHYRHGFEALHLHVGESLEGSRDCKWEREGQLGLVDVLYRSSGRSWIRTVDYSSGPGCRREWNTAVHLHKKKTHTHRAVTPTANNKVKGRIIAVDCLEKIDSNSKLCGIQ